MKVYQGSYFECLSHLNGVWVAAHHWSFVWMQGRQEAFILYLYGLSIWLLVLTFSLFGVRNLWVSFHVIGTDLSFLLHVEIADLDFAEKNGWLLVFLTAKEKRRLNVIYRFWLLLLWHCLASIAIVMRDLWGAALIFTGKWLIGWLLSKW